MPPPLCSTLLTLIDPTLLEDATTTYVIQVNGKLRGRFDLPKGKSEHEILDLAKQEKAVDQAINGKSIRRLIFVPDKLLNIVV